MESWRFLTHDGVGAAAGLAVDEALMKTHRRDLELSAPTLRLYTYASHCGLVGRYQNLEAEIDLDACDETDTAVGRRPTGGGAIVMGTGQLGVAVAARAQAGQPKELLKTYAAAIVRGLEEVGITASFRGKNDLEVNGRKIAGLGVCVDDHGALLFHSSILADLDVPFMLKVLRIPAAKLGDKAVAAVSERVTTVARETGESWTGSALRDVISTGFEKEFGISLGPGSLTPDEEAEASSLEAEKYAHPDWIFQRSPSADLQGTTLLKTPEGLMRVYLSLENGAIKNVLFAGDFNEFPDALVRIESALRWVRLDADRVEAVVARACGGDDAFQVPPEQIVQAILEAGERASSRQAAHPDRQGSCYFPEVG